MAHDARDRQAMAAAWLFHAGLKQEEIQKALNIGNQTEVSRLLKHARERHWLKWHLNIPEEELPEIQARAYPRLRDLTARLDSLARDNKGVQVSRISIVYSRADEPAALGMERFGQQAAEHVLPLLRNTETRICAVAWGRTMKAFVDAVQPQTKNRPDLEFVPVSGEPGRFPYDSISPTQVAERLATAFGAQCLSLHGIAARIPKRLKDRAKVIREFVGGCKDYEAILDGKEPKIGQAQIIITGIGNARSSKDDAWFKETAQLEEINDLQKIAAGNIGGVWIPESDKDQKRIAEINDRWLGIQQRDFEACAHRGHRSGLGVVVLAVEQQKARIIKRAVGLINHLVISESLANAILDD